MSSRKTLDTVVAGPKSMHTHGTYAVIRDPLGAGLALVETPAQTH